MNGNSKKIYMWLRQDGFSHAAASGIIGNLSVETGDSFDPKIKQDGGPGRGIAQWTDGARWDDLVNFAERKGNDPMDLRTQYDFMLHEMKNGGLGNFDLREFKQMTNARQAADYFDANFEGSWSRDDEERRDRARQARKDYKGMADGEGGGAQLSGPTGMDIINKARKYVGVPYVGSLGTGASPKRGWDCSTFTWWILKDMGFKNPPTFSENYISAYPQVKGWRGKGAGGVDWDKVRPGDIIVYRAPGTNGGGANGHVAFYAGNGRTFEAASRDKGTIKGHAWYSGSKPIVAIVRPAEDPGAPANFRTNGAPGGSRYGSSRSDKLMSMLGISDDILDLKDAKGNYINADLRDLIEEAVDGEWGADLFKQRVMSSEWYQSRNKAQRAFDMMQKADREDLLAQTITTLDALAGGMGVELTDQQKAKLSFKIARNGLYDSKEMMSYMLAKRWNPDEQGNESGMVAEFNAAIDQRANEYGYKVSDADREAWTRQVLQGKASVDSFEDDMKIAAEQRLKALAPGIGLDGKTLRQALSPYLQVASQELGVDADQIDLSDDKWLRLSDPSSPDRAMNTADWRRTIRTDKSYDWENGETAGQVARNMATALAQAFGRV